MDALRSFTLCLPAACALAASAAPAWHAVPGAPDLAIDLASVQQERTRVSAWLRWWGRPAFVPELAAWNARAPRVQRTLLRTEFDCSRRTWRVLAAHAYGSDGTPLSMSSMPGPALPVQEAELAWAYDAVCEAARAGS